MDGARRDHTEAEELERCAREVSAVLRDVLDARLPAPIPEDGHGPATLPLVQAANRLVSFAGKVEALVRPLLRDQAGAPSPAPGGLMAAHLTALRERLGLPADDAVAAAPDGDDRDRHGDARDAFDAMARSLLQREEALRAEIARREEAERRLQRERDLLVAGPLVTFRWDTRDEGIVSYVSPNISTFGYEAEDFMSGRRRYTDIIHPDDLGWLMEDGGRRTRSGLESWASDYRVLDRAGGTHWVRDHTHCVRDTGGAVVRYEGYIIDITAQKRVEAELRRREEQLRMLSLSDEVTGLFNRRGLFAVGEHLVRVARRHRSGLSVLYVDVDGLRRINDRHGRDQGDAALRLVAGALRQITAESDVLGRAGGDEFVALVEAREDATVELSRRLRLRLSSTPTPHRAPVGVALGRLHWRAGDGADLQTLIDGALADLRVRHNGSGS